MKLAKLAPPARVLAAGSLAATLAIGLQAGESKAAIGDSVTCLALSCTELILGDKKAYGFSFDFTRAPGDEIQLTQLGAVEYQLQYSFNPTSTTVKSGTLGYTLAVTDPNFTLFRAQANITGGGLGDTVASKASSVSLLAPGFSSSTGGPGTIATFPDLTTVAAFTQTFSSTGSMNSFGLTFNQKEPPSKVPGPLPLLGAGAAFGFSRKLRHRVKQAA